MLHRLFVASACLIMCTQFGCQGERGPRTVTAEGTIMLDGEPLEGAAVVFVSMEYPAQSISDADGRFSLDAFEYKPGAVPGTYQTVITKTVEVLEGGTPPPGSEAALHMAQEIAEGGGPLQLGVRNALPQRYAAPSEEFTFVVPEDGTTELLIELDSKADGE